MVTPVAWTSKNQENQQKWRQRDRTVTPVAWSARMVRRIYGESFGWKCSSSQGRTRDFFSWINFRAARKSGIGQALYLYSLPEGPKLRHLHEDPENKTRAPCRKRTGTAVPRAQKVWWVDDSRSQSPSWCESRNNHRYAVVVQIFASQWIRSCPCKTITFQETEKSLQKFLEPMKKPKVIYTNNSLEFGKACEDVSWNHCTSTPHRSETNGIAERTLRRIKEGTSRVLLQSGLN